LRYLGFIAEPEPHAELEETAQLCRRRRVRPGTRCLVCRASHDHDIDRDPHAFYQRAADHIGATREFVPPELEEVRFSYRQRPGIDRDRISALTIEQRRKLYEYFADDLAKLEKMLGRDLSSWDPDRSS